MMIKTPAGQGYVAFLHELHSKVLVDWYLEIGCRNGRMFAPVRGKTIAVDPFFRTELNIIGSKPALHVFQQKSDDFFASEFLPRNDIRLSFAFIDGMHLFEYLLRDFMNVEENSADGAVVMMHDCCPHTPEMTSRNLGNLVQGIGWTGDVWKIIPILQEYRPDLTITPLDCRPTGLLTVTGLDCTNRVLQENYAGIIARYEAMTLEAFGIDRYNECVTFSNPRRQAAEDYPLFAKVRLDPDLALTPSFVSP